MSISSPKRSIGVRIVRDDAVVKDWLNDNIQDISHFVR